MIRILNREGFAYVEGLTDPFLPLPARIVSVADFFDAMTPARPYRSAISVEATLAELLRLRGRSFDPTVVDAFFQLEDPASLV